jgi:hypothetical protein
VIRIQVSLSKWIGRIGPNAPRLRFRKLGVVEEIVVIRSTDDNSDDYHYNYYCYDCGIVMMMTMMTVVVDVVVVVVVVLVVVVVVDDAAAANVVVDMLMYVLHIIALKGILDKYNRRHCISGDNWRRRFKIKWIKTQGIVARKVYTRQK